MISFSSRLSRAPHPASPPRSLCAPDGARLALIGLVVIYLGLAATYNLATPIFEAPDEIWHYLYIRSLVLDRRLPLQTGRGEEAGAGPPSAVLAQQEAAQPPLYYLTAAILTAPAPRDDLAALARENPAGSIGDPRTEGNKNRFLHPPAQDFPWRGEVLTVHLTRLVSTLWGALTVILTYAVGRALTRSSAVAFGAAAAAAFNPQFLFMTAAISNDAAVAASGALLTWLALRAAHRPLGWRRTLLLGTTSGIVVLSKPIAVGAVGLAGLAIILAGRRTDAPAARIGAHLAAATGALLATTGWWFVYNLLVYSTPVPLARFLGRRVLLDSLPTAGEVLADLAGLRWSYWGVFGWFSILAPPLFYRLCDTLLALGAMGLGLLAARALWRRPHPTLLADAAGLLLVAWLVLSVLGAVAVYRLVTEAFQGRLVFGAIAGISSLLAIGWASLAPGRAGRALAIIFPTSLLVPAALFPWTVIAPAYARPPRLPPTAIQPTHPLDAWLGGDIRLLGADIHPDPGDVRPGTDLEIALYLTSTRPITRDYTLFVKLLDFRQREVIGLDTYPGRGAWPTSFWQPGEVIIDRYHLHVPAAIAAPGVYRLAVGMYWRPTMTPLPVRAGEGPPLGGAFPIAPVVVRDPPDPDRAGRGVRFADAVTLVAGRLDQTTRRAGQTLTGELLLGAVRAVPRDYTLFIHLVGPHGLIAQDDSQPLRGAFPTSAWRPGDLIRHPFRLVIPLGTPPGTCRVVVGWYDLATGERLPTPNGDSVEIGVLRIEAAR